MSSTAVLPIVSQNFLALSPGYTTVTPSSANSSVSRAGNATLFDSTGKLTYAPNNQVLQSQTIDNAAWTKAAATVSANAATAPDDTLTADKITATATTGDHGAYQNISAIVNGARYVISVYAKAAEYNLISIADLGNARFAARFDLSTGAFVSAVGAGYVSNSITSVGNGWYRCSVVVTGGSTGWALSFVGYPSSVTPGPTGANYTGDGTSGIYVWGAQLEAVTYQTTPSTYVATTASAYYGPRYDYNPSTLASKGLLVEAAATNILTYSQAFNSWSATSASATATTTSPDGTSNAFAFVPASGTAGYITNPAPINHGTAYTYSIYFKGNGLSEFTYYAGGLGADRSGITITLSNNATTAYTTGAASSPTNVSIANVGNGFYRLQFSATIPGASTTSAVVRYLGGAADGVKGVYLFGAQVETTTFATSYIPTTSASVTRAAETYTPTAYTSQLVMATYTDEQTGSTYYVNLNPGNTWAGNGWITSLRAYDGTAAAVPTWLDVSATTGNRMLTDSTGKLTYAPNNMLTYSEQFDNAVWAKVNATVTTNSIVSPDGTQTADTLTTSGVATTQRVSRSITDTGPLVFSVYAKAGSAQYLQLMSGSTSNIFANFDLTLGVVGTVGSSASATISNVGNGWYRCAVYANIPGSGILGAYIVSSASAAYGSSYPATVASLYLWGAQLEAVTYQTLPSTYIPTTTAAYYGPRFDYDPSTLAAKGLLIEESRANLLTYSEQFDNAAWNKNSSTVSANAATSPDGAVSADLATTSATGGWVARSGVTGSVSTTYTASIYVKPVSASFARIYIGGGGAGGLDGGYSFNLITGASTPIGATTVPMVAQNVGNGWWRIGISFTTNASDNIFDVIFQWGTDISLTSPSSVYLFGAQLEVGSFATSYIPTTTASVTRAADVIKLSGAALTTLQGTAFSASVQATLLSTATSAVLIGSGTGATQAIMFANAASSVRNFDQSSSPVNSTPASAGSGSWLTVARACFAADASSRTLVLSNGTVVTTSGPLVTARTNARIGAFVDGTLPMSGWVNSLAIYNQRLPNATLQSKSVVGSPL